MITAHQLTGRLWCASHALRQDPTNRLTAGATAQRLTAVLADLDEVQKGATITKALQHLHDHEAGYPATSMPAPGGTGSHSNRTQDLVVGPDGHHHVDQVMRDRNELDERSRRLARGCLEIYAGRPDIYHLAKTLEDDARLIRSILKAWAREPDIRWCTNCLRTNNYKNPVHQGRYRELCRRCGEWKATNGKLPSKKIIGYLQTNQVGRIPAQLLASERVKIPKPWRKRS